MPHYDWSLVRLCISRCPCSLAFPSPGMLVGLAAGCDDLCLSSSTSILRLCVLFRSKHAKTGAISLPSPRGSRLRVFSAFASAATHFSRIRHASGRAAAPPVCCAFPSSTGSGAIEISSTAAFSGQALALACRTPASLDDVSHLAIAAQLRRQGIESLNFRVSVSLRPKRPSGFGNLDRETTSIHNGVLARPTLLPPP